MVVTVGIVAILFIMLSPGLATGSDRAKRAKCQGVLRQAYLTTMLYVHDNNGFLPPLAVMLKPSPSAPACPGADSRIQPIVKGGYDWNDNAYDHEDRFPTPPWVQARFEAYAPGMWMILDHIPWHDRKRSRDTHNGNWLGFLNEIRFDGGVEYRKYSVVN
jgi:hypothetical protein